MPQTSIVPTSAYLTALTQEIEKKLLRALTSQSQRINLLRELFADIALEVDGRDPGYTFGVVDPDLSALELKTDIILNKNEVGVSPVDDETESYICFYDVLADHYVKMPQDGKPALDLIVQLWSQSFASHIFALLFQKWLFEVELKNSEVFLRYSSALVQGATNVFWIDIQTNTRLFFSLFHYLLEDVALVIKKKGRTQCTRLPLYVGSGEGLELRMTMSTQLKACLYSFTSPGGPMYPTRVVRHAAWDTLDLLFPVGRYPRHLISLFFRLLYPWYWPSSCWNFVVSCITAIVYSILWLIFSSWENLRKPKNH